MTLHHDFAGRLLRAQLAVWLLLAWSGMWGPGAVAALGADAAPPADGPDRLRAIGVALQQYANTLAAVEPLLDHTRFDPAAVVNTVGRDPAKLAAWVGKNTSIAPYSGCLRGPVGVLMDRRGNSLDRALLMCELFHLAGAKARLAHGKLPPAQVDAFMRAPTTVATNASDDGAADARIASATGIPLDEVRQTIRQQEIRAEKAQEDFANTTTDQTQKLLKMLEAAGIKPTADASPAAAAASVADHWWAQYNAGGSWIDADPAPDGTIGPKPLCDADQTLDIGQGWDKAMAAGRLLHEVVVRVRGERSAAKGRHEFTALESTFAPAVLAGGALTLLITPRDWPARLDFTAPDANQQLKTALLTQKSWVPVIRSSAGTIQQDGFDEHGGVLSHPRLDAPGRTGESTVIGGQGALDAFRGGAAPAADDGVLTAVWIEYEVRQPGAASKTFRRDIFDAYGPAVRARALPAAAPTADDAFKLRRSAALTCRVEILPAGCLLAGDFVSEQAITDVRQSVEAATTPLREAIAGQTASAIEKLLAIVHAPVPLLALAALRGQPDAASPQPAVNVMNLFTRQQCLRVNPDGSIAGMTAIDIVSNPVAFASADPFSLAVRQGVGDTNLERRLGGDAPSRNTAAAFRLSDSQNVGWDLLKSPQEVAALGLSDDAKARITAELSEGFVVVAPRKPVVNGTLACEDWWRIDPRTGNTLGIDVSGRGDEEAEEGGILWNVALYSVITGYLTYTGCMGDHKAAVNWRTVGCIVCGVATAVLSYFGAAGEKDLGGAFGTWAAGFGGAKRGLELGVLCGAISG